MPNETAKRFLESLTIASPCEVNWDEMTGDEQTRFCDHCEKNVYNISEMSRKEAENLIRENEGNVCVRMYRRHDGTVINDDCPVGLRTLRRGYRFLKARTWQIAAAFAAIVSSVFTVPSIAQNQDSKTDKQNSQAGKDNKTTKAPSNPGVSAPSKREHVLMGKIACPPPTPAQLAAEESYKKEISAKILAKLPKGKTLSKGSIFFQVNTTGEVTNFYVNDSSGDENMDKLIESTVKGMKVTPPKDGFSSYRNIRLNLSDVESLGAKKT